MAMEYNFKLKLRENHIILDKRFQWHKKNGYHSIIICITDFFYFCYFILIYTIYKEFNHNLNKKIFQNDNPTHV